MGWISICSLRCIELFEQGLELRVRIRQLGAKDLQLL